MLVIWKEKKINQREYNYIILIFDHTNDFLKMPSAHVFPLTHRAAPLWAYRVCQAYMPKTPEG